LSRGFLWFVGGRVESAGPCLGLFPGVAWVDTTGKSHSLVRAHHRLGVVALRLCWPATEFVTTEMVETQKVGNEFAAAQAFCAPWNGQSHEVGERAARTTRLICEAHGGSRRYDGPCDWILGEDKGALVFVLTSGFFFYLAAGVSQTDAGCEMEQSEDVWCRHHVCDHGGSPGDRHAGIDRVLPLLVFGTFRAVSPLLGRLVASRPRRSPRPGRQKSPAGFSARTS
jgi:hypothetical protein